MLTVRRARTSPEPPQVGQRSDGTCPRPRHIGHGRLTAKPPCPKEIIPRPLHSGQVLKVAPGAAPFPWHVGHSSFTSRLMGTFPPSAATRNGISTVVSTLCPRSGPRARPPRPPPNIELKRSPRPPSPPSPL